MSRTKEVIATLRQMIALLEGERQALAAMDLDRISNCTSGKLQICEKLEAVERGDLDEECLGLLDAVEHIIQHRVEHIDCDDFRECLDLAIRQQGVSRGRTPVSLN